MSAPMKKRPTDEVSVILDRSRYRVPKEVAKGMRLMLSAYEVDTIPAGEVFADLHKKYTRGGAVLKGFRLRDELTQEQLAEKIGATQGDVSDMECGGRPIGRAIAQRLATVFKTDYRVFLQSSD
jgi:DNA-binding XRE family transcriptional regulator